jgi:D-3-phosphoglycerate dehydrogenase / 2-oxoglutarate reductase
MPGTKKYHVVVAEPYDPSALARMEEVARITILEDSAPETLVNAVADADALCVRGRAHVTARVINAGDRLKVIARASPTVDHIDLRAASRKNIHVVYAPHVAVASTAEFTLGLILALHRRVPFLDRAVRDGEFESLRVPSGRELSYTTLGLLGLDPVAQRLGRMVNAAFEMPIIYHDPAGGTATDFSGRAVTLDELLAESDVLSLHLGLTSATRGIINAQTLAKLKSTALLVNTARGPLIDSAALAQALRRKLIGGAALDVFDLEPLPADHPLRRVPNCILTPHVAGATLNASSDRFTVAEDVVRVLLGQPPAYPVALPDG